MISDRLLEKLDDLKKRRRAVILAHNYQPGLIQDIADFTGDSLGLSVKAAETDAEVIVFCGVRFMAETAAILSPQKTVLLPDEYAGCPLADMITADQLAELKQRHPGSPVVCYVNSCAGVKATSDYCCTSSNAVELVASLETDRDIIFVPDRHLGRFVAEKTAQKIVLWPGYCPTHVVITERDIMQARRRWPDAVVMAHPECTEPVKALADRVLSTGQMLRFAAESTARRFIVATETGMVHALEKQAERLGRSCEFTAASERAVCPNMKRIGLDAVIASLENNRYRVTVPEDIRKKAKKALDRMVTTKGN
jgi:quinolinate synthase